MEIVDLGFRPREWQRECFRRMKRFSVVVVHRRGGKTVMAIMRLLDAALRNQNRMARYAYLAPLLKQAKTVAWAILKDFAVKIPGIEINESELWIRVSHGPQIRLFGADNPDAMRGVGLDGVVVDETAQMRSEVWGEILRPALADKGGWALFIGTPKGINLFSQIYFAAIADPNWMAVSYTVNDTKALSDSEVQAMREVMTENEFRQEMLCDFAAASDDNLIAMDLVSAAMSRKLRSSEFEFAARVLGVDVARQGGDRTVLFPRQGLAAFSPVVLQGANAMEVASRVAQAIDKWEADACFIDGSGGYGAGVIDRLLQLGYTPIEVQFGGKALDNRFTNKRTEMWWEMADWIKRGGMLPNLPGLRAELCAPTYDYANAAGKLELERKDKIKERIGLSPDLADALALTFAYPVTPRERNEFGKVLAVSGKVSIDAEVGDSWNA